MMSYTTPLINVIGAYAEADNVDGCNINEMIETARPKIFNFDYELFDEAYKPIIEQKFLAHYIDYEVAFDSIGRWHFYLQTKWREEVEFYNQLWKSALLEFNPLEDYNVTRESKRKIGSEGATTSEVTNKDTTDMNLVNSGSDSTKVEGTVKNKHTDAYSNTPENGLSGVENLTYLTDARFLSDDNATTDTSTTTLGSTQSNKGTVDSAGNAKGTNKFNSEDAYTEHVFGKLTGVSYSDLLKEFRSTFRNIDKEFIESLRDLFLYIF